MASEVIIKKFLSLQGFFLARTFQQQVLSGGSNVCARVYADVCMFYHTDFIRYFRVKKQCVG